MADERKNALTEFVRYPLVFLLELNLACAAKEKAGKKNHAARLAVASGRTHGVCY